MPNFNERLKLLRGEFKMTQQELADKIGVSKSSVNMYERGEREPGFATLEALADTFNVDMDYLLGKSNHRSKFAWAVDSGHSPTPAPLDAKIAHAREREALQGPGYRMLLDPDANLTEADLEDIKEFIAFKQRKYGR